MEDVRQLIQTACDLHGQSKVAAALEVTTRTVRRWQVRENEPPPYLPDAIRQRLLPLTAPDTNATPARFTFADLFAGIGGIRAGFEAHGGQCVFTSEWNTWAHKTYVENFPPAPGHVFAGDITQVDTGDIPDHDILLAGFPCQPFSIAGVSKKNALGRKHGFADETQGTLFFDVARIIAAKKPRAFLLENVKNLVRHDKGNTFRVIVKTLREELGYHIHHKVIDGARFVPQHRERILIVGFREPTDFSWDDLRLPAEGPRLASILHPQDGSEATEGHFTTGPKAKVDARYTLTQHLWNYLQAYAEKHRAAGNGFGFGLVHRDSVTRTLSARYYKDGSEILVSQGPRKRPRRLTPRECARLMGFPDSFKIPVSDTQAYKLFSQAAVVPMIESVAKSIVDKLGARELTMDVPEISSKAFSGKNWSREQLKLAFYFYCQTPFGQLHGKNQNVVELAKLIGRTPGAVAMKCVNFASLDPAIRASGRSGLSNASRSDREIWNEFHADWERLAAECASLYHYLRHEHGLRDAARDDDTESDQFDLSDYTGETRKALVAQRVKQSFFRRAVLSSYRGRCCISGVSEPRLLIASHIAPWSEDKTNRLNPSNGLCLSAIHDKAFDAHLFTLSDDWRVILSNQLRASKDKFINEVFGSIQDRKIELPERFVPSKIFLTQHREKTLS